MQMRVCEIFVLASGLCFGQIVGRPYEAGGQRIAGLEAASEHAGTSFASLCFGKQYAGCELKDEGNFLFERLTRHPKYNSHERSLAWMTFEQRAAYDSLIGNMYDIAKRLEPFGGSEAKLSEQPYQELKDRAEAARAGFERFTSTHPTQLRKALDFQKRVNKALALFEKDLPAIKSLSATDNTYNIGAIK